MQPNRVRTFASPEKYSLYEGDTQEALMMPVKWQQIADVNNGRRRPLSPCVNSKVIAKPAYAEPASWLGPGAVRATLNVPPNLLIKHLLNFCDPVINEQESSALKAIQNKTNKIAGEFSSLNFLYELREVGSLFLDINGKIRRLSSYRPIDYLFGVQPLIGDTINALQQYDSVAQSANERLKRFKNVPINRRFVGEVTRKGEISFFTGNGHYQDDGATVVTTVKGEISCGIPWLAQIDPGAYRVLDALAIDLSPSNAYNAIPWSWAFDWVFPMGDFLQSLPSAMRPEFFFRGTISTKIKGYHTTETRYSGPGYYFNDGDIGSSFATTHYARKVFNGPTTGMVKWDFAGGINSLARSLIARDIIFQKKTPSRKGPGIGKVFS